MEQKFIKVRQAFLRPDDERYAVHVHVCLYGSRGDDGVAGGLIIQIKPRVFQKVRVEHLLITGNENTLAIVGERWPEDRRRINDVAAGGELEAVRGRVADVRRQLQQAMHAGGVVIRRVNRNPRNHNTIGVRHHQIRELWIGELCRDQQLAHRIRKEAKRRPVREAGHCAGVDLPGEQIHIVVIEVQFVPVRRQRIRAQLRHQAVKGVLVIGARADKRGAQPAVNQVGGDFVRVEQLKNIHEPVGIVAARPGQSRIVRVLWEFDAGHQRPVAVLINLVIAKPGSDRQAKRLIDRFQARPPALIAIRQNAERVDERRPAAGNIVCGIVTVAVRVPSVRVELPEERRQVYLPRAASLVAEKIRCDRPRHSRIPRVIMTVIDVERFSRRHHHEGIASDELVARRMRPVRVLQNANPFRIAHQQRGRRRNNAVGVENPLNPVRVEAPVAIQVQVEAKFGGSAREIGDDKDRRARVVEQVGLVLADISVPVERLASTGVHVTDIHQARQVGSEAVRIDKIRRYQEVVSE